MQPHLFPTAPVPADRFIATIPAMSTLETRPLDPNTEAFLKEAAESPYDFHSLSTKAAGDEQLKRQINSAVTTRDAARQLRLLEVPDSNKLRILAGQIKQ